MVLKVRGRCIWELFGIRVTCEMKGVYEEQVEFSKLFFLYIHFQKF